ncbi:MAG: NTP transferase domain-containing protein, partial [Patescibacteria group bacterium]|nr:NTP transferase domain-containing protein [Patescibacteria group bacterium]
MQAVLLAAGNSSRFVPFTGFGHKSLIQLMGKTIIEHTVLSVKRSGIGDIVIVIGKDSPVKEIIGDGKKFGVTITYVILPEALGMGAAVLAAKEHLQERFFVINAYHMEFDQFAKDMQALQITDDQVVMLGKAADGKGYGFLQHSGKDVTGVFEKPKETLKDALQIVGVYLINRTFLATLEKTPLEHYHFETALHTYAQTKKITFMETRKPTLTLKYAWDLFAIKDYLLSRLTAPYISPNAVVSPQAVLKGNVYVEEGATVLEGACLKGPVYVGKQAFV